MRAFGVAAVLLAASAVWADDTARDLMLRSLQKNGLVRCVLVQTYLVTDGRTGPVRIKLEMDGEGRSRRTVLQPIRMEGNVWIDDGRRWGALSPDQKRLLIQPSPSRSRLDPKIRMALIDRNYTLSIIGPSTIAGRKTTTILAQPKDDELAARRFFIDPENGLILQSEVGDLKGKMDKTIETHLVSFPKRLDPGIFRIPEGDDSLEVVKTDWPKRLREPSKASPLVGFTPRLKPELPSGFVISEVHLVGNEDAAFLAVRLTDGLALVTVYQWDTHKRLPNLPSRGRGHGIDGEGVCYYAVGDVSPSMRRRLAEAFLRLGPPAKAQIGDRVAEGTADDPCAASRARHDRHTPPAARVQ